MDKGGPLILPGCSKGDGVSWRDLRGKMGFFTSLPVALVGHSHTGHQRQRPPTDAESQSPTSFKDLPQRKTVSDDRGSA